MAGLVSTGWIATLVIGIIWATKFGSYWEYQQGTMTGDYGVKKWEQASCTVRQQGEMIAWWSTSDSQTNEYYKVKIPVLVDTGEYSSEPYNATAQKYACFWNRGLLEKQHRRIDESASAKKLIEHYGVGDVIKCWVNPEESKQVALKNRNPWEYERAVGLWLLWTPIVLVALPALLALLYFLVVYGRKMKVSYLQQSEEHWMTTQEPPSKLVRQLSANETAAIGVQKRLKFLKGKDEPKAEAEPKAPEQPGLQKQDSVGTLQRRQIIGTLDKFKLEADSYKAGCLLKFMIKLIQEMEDFGTRNFDQLKVPALRTLVKDKTDQLGDLNYKVYIQASMIKLFEVLHKKAPNVYFNPQGLGTLGTVENTL